MNLFARARLNLNLTPMERAILRFAEGTLVGAVVAGAQAVLPMLSDSTLATPQNIAWGSVTHTFVAAFVAALVLAVRKYFAAQADPALPADGGGSNTTPTPPGTPATASAPSQSQAGALPVGDGVPAFPPGVSLASIQAALSSDTAPATE